MRSYPRPETRVLCLKSYAMMLTLITLWRRVRTDWVDNSLGIYLFLAYSACETCICVAFTIQSNAEQREHNNNVTVALYQDTQCANGGYTASVECEREFWRSTKIYSTTLVHVFGRWLKMNILFLHIYIFVLMIFSILLAIFGNLTRPKVNRISDVVLLGQRARERRANTSIRFISLDRLSQFCGHSVHPWFLPSKDNFSNRMSWPFSMATCDAMQFEADSCHRDLFTHTLVVTMRQLRRVCGQCVQFWWIAFTY